MKPIEVLSSFQTRVVAWKKLRHLALTMAVVLLGGSSSWGELPAGWTDADIGSPSQAGSATCSGGNWTIYGGGSDIWNASDQFNYAYTSVSGDQYIIAKITSLAETDVWAKGGLMFRDDNTSTARFVALEVTPENGVTLQWRSATASDCGNTGISGVAPVWLKLVRSGNVFTGYSSSDGNTWTSVGSTTITLNTACLLGLVVTAHNDSTLCQCGFSDVTLSGGSISYTGPVCGVYREMYTGLDFSGGNTIAIFTNSSSFPNNPNTNYTRVYSAFETDSNVGDNYGQRLRAFLIPPTNGDYTFWISSDDSSQLFLSTDETAANRTLIASVNSWTPSRVWTSEANQQSSPITLVAGRRYYVEALMQEGSGGDNLAVRWMLPDGTYEEPIPATAYSVIRMLPYDGKVVTPGIYIQSTNVTAIEGTDAMLSILATNTTSLGYQWFTGGNPISGATNSVYKVSSVNSTMNGKTFLCVASNSLGTVTSSPITLTVVADYTPPVALRAFNVGWTNVIVVFSKLMDPTSTVNIGNYVFTNGLSILGASLGSDGMSVTLTTAPMVVGSNYVLVINNVRDRSSVGNVIAANTKLSFSALSLSSQDIGNPSVSGTLSVTATGMSMTAAGSDVGGTADQFGFAYQMETGNFDVSVKLTGFKADDVWAKAGLMAREALTTSSRFAAVLTTPAMNGTFFESRVTPSGSVSTSGSFPANFPNSWLRLKRVGNTFYGYASYDGLTWTSLGSMPIVMPSQIYLGISVSSHDSISTATTSFGTLTDMQGTVVTGTVTDPREPLGPSSRKTPLIISEIMYKPAPRADSNNLEFIEIYNSNPYFQDISGYRLAGQVDYTFPAKTILQGGAFLVVAAAPADVESVYGMSGVMGPYDGKLKKSGTIKLLDEADAVLLTVPYSDSYPWPVGASGTGHSIVLAKPTYGEEDPRAWAISQTMGGSPGTMDPFCPSSLKSVVINEILAHTEDPTMSDFVELYNHSNVTNDLSDCILTDDASTNRFVIPSGTLIGPRSFLSLDQSQLGFGLSAKGGTIFLIDSKHTRVLDAVQYDGQADGISYGRWPDGADAFYPLQTRTPGASNSAVLIGDIVINELMYDPISGDDDDQYIELYNKGTQTIDLSNWQFTSGVSFTFPTNVAIAPDGYVVVGCNVSNLLAKYSNLNLGNTFGNYSGKLSHNGDRVVLSMPQNLTGTNSSGILVTNVIYVAEDEVIYGTGGRWGQWAAGGGSSLELINPNANHRQAANWADSDESSKSSWTNIEATGVLDNGVNLDPAIDFAQVGLLDVGECLIDNVSVLYNNVNYISNSTFENGTNTWRLEGCHVRSSLENSGYLSSKSLHIRCSDRFWTGANSCGVPLNNTSLSSGKTVTLRFAARWLHGWPEAIMRLSGNWLEASGKMPVPQNLGTPGMRNSCYSSTVGPAMYEVTHSPAVPPASQAVVVKARASSASSVKSLMLYYRIDPQTAYSSILMRDDGTSGDDVAGDGIYSATISGQSAGTIVAYYIQATDMNGNTTRFPALLTDNSPTREAVIMFGDDHTGGGFGVYHLWITQASANRWSSLPNLSNESFDCTIVNGTRVIYNAQARFTGSPYHQNFDAPTGSLCHYKWIFPDDDKFLGATSFNKIHQPGNGAGDDNSLQREQVANSLLRALKVPWLYRRHVVVYVNGNKRGQLMEDAQTPDGDVVKEHFPDDKDGFLYKMQPWFEFGITNVGSYCNFSMPAWCQLTSYTTTGGVKKRAPYRWTFMVRRTADSADNYTNVYRLVDAASTYGMTGYADNMKSIANMENWMRVFAANHAGGNWDSFGAQNAQNLYGYVGTQGTKYSLLMFDFNISIGNSGCWSPGENLFTVNGNDPNTANIYNEPEFRRMYWRALQELVKGPLDVANSGPLIDAKYKALIASGATVENTTAIKTWLTSAHDSIASQIAAVESTNFTISAVTVTNGIANITGTAPFGVKTIWIDGEEVLVTWTSVQAWRVAMPVATGTNVLNIIGVDMDGKQVSGASKSVAVVNKTTTVSPVGKVVINEIMFDPPTSGAEYVELYNTSTNTYFDLSGMVFHGLSYTFPEGSYIAPKSYLVLAADRMVFSSVYGTSVPVFDTFDGKLKLDGETLSLIIPSTNNDVGTYVSRVRYENALPWNTNASGSGASLQLIDPSQDNWRVANWGVASTNFTPQWVYATASIGAPTAASTTFYLYLQSAGDIYIDDMTLVKSGTTSSVLKDGNFETALSGSWTVSSGFSQSTLSTATNHSGSSSLHMVATAAGSGTGNAIYQTVSGLDTSSSYVVGFWYLQSTNGGPLTVRFSSGTASQLNVNPSPLTTVSYKSPGAVNGMATKLATFQPLLINELQPENLTGITNSAGQRVGWIEIYNPSTNVVSLAGLYLANEYTNLTQWAFPSNASIGAGQFTVIFTDGLTNLQTASELHANFVLPAGAGSLALSRLGSSGEPEVLDYVNYTNVEPNRSYGSYPDGQSFTRQQFYYTTPGALNNGSSMPLTVSINEWMAGNTNTLVNPVTGKYDDWFELYNYGSNTVDLAGYYLTHVLTNQFEFEIPSGYTIAPHSFLLVWADKKSTTGMPDLHASFKLSKSGTSIGLFGPDGVAVDFITFQAMDSGTSMGRYPDGSDNIELLGTPTPKTNNIPAGSIPVSPSGLVAVADSGAISLTWNSVSDATEYVVKRSLSFEGPYINLATVGKARYVDSGLVNGTTYYYAVSAINGLGESPNSSVVSSTPVAPAVGTPTQILATPGDSQVSLAWSAVDGASGYYIKRSTVNGGPYSLLNSTVGTSYIDTAVDNGIVYYYVVSAFNVNGEGPYSPQASAMPQIPTPAAPSGLAAVATNNLVTLTWSPSATATNYFVKRSTVNGSGYVVVGSVAGTTYVDTTVTNGIRYYYVVSASNQGGEGLSSTQVSAMLQVPAPAAPTGLVATATNALVTLTWNAVDGATNYFVKRSTTDGSGYTLLASTTKTTYSDTALTNGIRYYYVVSAANQTGEGTNSSQVSALPQVSIPAAPTGLTATATNALVTLTWNAVDGATNFFVKRSITDGSGYTVLGATTKTTYSDTAVTNGIRYYYVVSASNQAGEGVNSSQVSALPQVPIPAAPTGLTATATNALVTLTWNAVDGATNYFVKRSTTDGSGYTLLASTTKTTYSDTAVTNGIRYYYVVSASNQAGEGVNSTQVLATPQVSVPTAPTGVIAVGGNSLVNLTWNAVSGATNYFVKRSTINGTGYVVIGSTSKSSYTDITVTNGVSYYYVVSASNERGESGNSTQALATPQGPASIKLSVSISAGNLVLSWPISANGFGVYTTTDLAKPNWQAVTNEIKTVNSNWNVVLPITHASAYYRLQK